MGIFRFVVRNWPLKLAAILLATLLYAGLIVSASAGNYDGSVSITTIGQPADSYLLDAAALPAITNIRYLLIGANRQLITSKSFTATIDLSNVKVQADAPPVSVPVTVRATDPGTVQILEYTPTRVQVRLDPITTRTEIPVTVNRGAIPEGLDPRAPVLSQDTVSVSGPDSYVRQVTGAEARVRIQAVDVNQDVDLVAIDARGEEVTGVTLAPRAVRVTIQVNPTLATKTVPVNPVVSGVPAVHYSVNSVVVAPVLVTLEGAPEVLSAIASVDTEPVVVTDIAKDVTRNVALVLPADVTALGVQTVKVTIDLTQDEGSRSYEIGVQLRNADPDTTYAIAVDRVIATFAGPLGALDDVDPATLVANLNVNGLGPGTSRVRVTLVVPSSLKLVAISPLEVSVTVTPRPTPTPNPTPPPSAEPTPPPSAEPTPPPTAAP